MNLARLGWFLALLFMATLLIACQPESPVDTPSTSLDPSPILNTPNGLPFPTATDQPTLTPTVIPTSKPTQTVIAQPVYTAITPQNAGRLAEVRVIDFGPWSQIISLEWAPDGRYLAVSTGNQLVLVDPQTWERVAQAELSASAPGLAISPDSRFLAAASRDGLLTLWEVSAGISFELTSLYSVEAHRKGANQVVFSPDGAWLASGGNDALAKVWVLQSGEQVSQIIGGSYAVADLAFSPDGAWLAIINSNLIRLRKPESGVMGLTLQALVPLFSLEYSLDGRWLAAGDTDNQVLLWDLEGGGTVRVVGEHSGRPGRVEALVWQVAFHPQGDMLASAGGEGAVRLWDIITGQSLAVLPGHGGAATSVRFSPDGLWLASGDLDGRLRVWGVK